MPGPAVLTEHTPEGRRFASRIDSFSFDGSDIDDEVFYQTDKKKHKVKKTRSNTDISSLPLRSGKCYPRPVNCFLSGKLQSIHPLTLENKRQTLTRSLSCGNIVTKHKMALDYIKVNQLVNSNIPIFTGENEISLNSDIEIFVKCCEQVYECLVGNEEIKLFLRLVSTKLRGRAFSVLSGESYKTFEEFKKLLFKKFANSKSYRLLVDELRLIRQVPGETISSFGERLYSSYQMCKNKALSTYQNCEALLSDLEELTVNTFLAGLIDSNLRLYFLRDNEKSLQNMLEKAKQIEARERELFIQNFHPIIKNFNQHCSINNSNTDHSTFFNSNSDNISSFLPNVNSTLLPAASTSYRDFESSVAMIIIKP